MGRGAWAPAGVGVLVWVAIALAIGGVAHSEPESLQVCLSSSVLDSISLGDSVLSWLPVDGDSDGVWELALALNSVPSKVGVHSPLDGQWLGGPLELAVDAENWTAANYDTDLTIEYAYLSGDSIRRFDPDPVTDVGLWSVPFTAQRAVFYGTTPQGEPTVALLKHQYFDTLEAQQDPAVIGHGYERWYLHRFRLVDGAFVDSVPAGPDIWTTIYDPSSPSAVSLLIDCRWRAWSSYFWTDESTLDSLQSLTPQWTVHRRWMTNAIGCYICSPNSARRILRNLATGKRDVNASPLMIIEVDSGSWYAGLTPQLAAFSADTAPALWRTVWTTPIVNSRYLRFAVADPDGDGISHCYMPVRDSSVWEVHDVSTGAELERLYGMPEVDLFAGPLFAPGEATLFYFRDSYLFYFRAETPTGILDDPRPEAEDHARLEIAARPNPFNSSVTLFWTSDTEATSVVIFNVLGQTVTELPIGARPEVVWDGRDTQNRACPSGIYFARLSSLKESTVRKLVLLR